MSILWILANYDDRPVLAASPTPGTNANAQTLAEHLIGDFAVRAVGSLASFGMLLRLSRNQWPDALVLDERRTPWDAKAIDGLLEQYGLAIPIIQVCAAKPVDPLPRPSQWFRCHAHAGSLDLSAYLAFVLSSSGRPNKPGIVRYGGLLLDAERRQILVAPGSEPVSLTHKETQLLRLLVDKAGVCLSRQTIQREIWGGVKVTPRTIDSHVSRLRQRLEPAAVEIQAVYGGGYILK